MTNNVASRPVFLKTENVVRGRDWRSSLNRERTGYASHTLPRRMTNTVAARPVFLKIGN
jgi:hypothetical protein